MAQNGKKIDAESTLPKDDLSESWKLHELKRVQSVKQMIKSYQHQKLTIKEALCNIDRKPANKITFDNNYSNQEVLVHPEESKDTGTKKTLFQSDDEEGEEDENSFNLKLKKQFDGEQGQQLFELQSKFKGDKRFKLDERFIETAEVEATAAQQSILEEEKKKEIDILEQVLGNKIKTQTSDSQSKRTQEKKILRYDPTQSEHMQYEIKTTKKQKHTKMKDDQQEKDPNIEDEQLQQPLVSKDVYYKVNNDLKETFEEQQGFSLLNLYSKDLGDEKHEENYNEAEIIDKKQKKNLDPNPFRYDSSDDEEITGQDHYLEADSTNQQVNTTRFISETFFFKDNDFRLQEGSDFVKRMASERNNEFEEQRRNLKYVMKAKVKNNHRKNNPFKKRLGGNKKKKLIKIKRALQR